MQYCCERRRTLYASRDSCSGQDLGHSDQNREENRGGDWEQKLEPENGVTSNVTQAAVKAT